MSEEIGGITIIVNAKKHLLTEKKISFEQVIMLANDEVGSLDKEYRMTYYNNSNEKTMNLTPGKSVKIHEGDIFNVV